MVGGGQELRRHTVMKHGRSGVAHSSMTLTKQSLTTVGFLLAFFCQLSYNLIDSKKTKSERASLK